MERYWRMLIDSLLDPVSLYRRLRYQPQPLFALIVAGVAQLSLTLSTDSMNVQYPLSVQGQVALPQSMMMLSLGIGQLLAFLAVVLCIHAAVRILGGRGTFAGAISAIGLATTPALLASPIYVLSSVTGLSVLMVIATPLIALWGLVLDVLAIREVYEVSTTRAVLSIVLSIVVLVLIGIALGLLFSLLFLLFAAAF